MNRKLNLWKITLNINFKITPSIELYWIFNFSYDFLLTICNFNKSLYLLSNFKGIIIEIILKSY